MHDPRFNGEETEAERRRDRGPWKSAVNASRKSENANNGESDMEGDGDDERNCCKFVTYRIGKSDAS